MIVWCDSAAEWLAFLRAHQYGISIGEELRAMALADRLRARDEAIPDATVAARWFGPVLCRDADQRSRLPALLGAWEMSVSGSSTQTLASGAELASTAAELGYGSAGNVATRQRRRMLAALLAVPIMIALVLASPFLMGRYASTITETIVDPTPTAQAAAREVLVASRIFGAALLCTPALTVAYLIWLRRRLHAALLRGLAPRDAPREALRIKLAELPLFSLTSLRANLSDLRRHWQVPANWIDGTRSATATVRNGGRVQLVHGWRPALPEYLLLADVRGTGDLLTVLADRLAALMREGDVQVDRFDFQGDPRRLRRLDSSGDTMEVVDLISLRSRCPQHRLIVLTDAKSFGDDQGGRLRSWVDQLRAWPEVALMTPLPARQWGPRERTLSRLGFSLAEATPDGLAHLAKQFRIGQISEGVATGSGGRPPRFDRRFAADAYRWMGDTSPIAADITVLLADLEEVLGGDVFLYLQALAVFPVLQPRLSLALGRLLVSDSGGVMLSEINLALLCRVPWMRTGRMPDWLRLALVRRLREDESREKRVLAVWSILLSPQTQDASDVLPLDVVRQVDPSLPALVARLVKNKDTHAEAILLAFLTRETLPDLAMALPGRDEVDLRWKVLGTRVALVLCAVLGATLGAAWLPEMWRIKGQFLDPARTLGWLAVGSGLLCVLCWYAREVSLFSRGPSDSKRRTTTGPLRWLPQASAVGCLALTMAGAALTGPNDSVLGTLTLAVQLVIWCVHAPAKPALRWLPVLILSTCFGSFNFGPEEFRWLGLGDSYLAILLMATLARRFSWQELKELLILGLPCLLTGHWVQIMPFSERGITDVAYGLGPSRFVLCFFITRLLGDDGFRKRVISPTFIDARAAACLLVPLSLTSRLIPPELQPFFFSWDTDVLLAAIFFAGLTVARSAGIFAAAFLAPTTTLGFNFDWSIWGRGSFGPELFVRWPLQLAALTQAWIIGLMLRNYLVSLPRIPMAGAHSGRANQLVSAWQNDKRARASGIQAAIGFMACAAALGTSFTIRPSFNSTTTFVLGDSKSLLLWAVLVVLTLARHVRLPVLWAGSLLVCTGVALAFWKPMMMVIDPFGLAFPSFAPLVLVPAIFWCAWLLAPYASTNKLTELASALFPGEGTKPQRLVLLDWGRWTWPAVAVSSLILAGAVLVAIYGERLEVQPDKAPVPFASGSAGPTSQSKEPDRGAQSGPTVE